LNVISAHTAVSPAPAPLRYLMLALMPVTGERAVEELAEVIPEGLRDGG
jgi:hypothetical protein